MRASKPAGDVLNSEAPSPVNEVIITMVSGEPDGVVAPAVPPTMPVTAAGARTSAATPNLPRCLPKG